jgi:hypothetical protein
MIHFTHYTSVNQSILTCNCSLFSNHASLCDIFGQSIYRIRWTHIDLFCPIFPCVVYSSVFPLYWWYSTPFQPCCWPPYWPNTPGLGGEAYITQFTGFSGFWMPLSWAISDFLSASHSTSLQLGLSKSQFQLSQLSVSKMHSGSPSLLLSTGWWSIVLNQGTFITWVRPSESSSAHAACGTGGHSNHLKFSHTIMLNVWWGRFDNRLWIWTVTNGCHSDVLSMTFRMCS